MNLPSETPRPASANSNQVPPKARTMRLRKAARGALAEVDVRAIIAVVKEKALRGDLSAIELLLSLTCRDKRE